MAEMELGDISTDHRNISQISVQQHSLSHEVSLDDDIERQYRVSGSLHSGSPSIHEADFNQNQVR